MMSSTDSAMGGTVVSSFLRLAIVSFIIARCNSGGGRHPNTVEGVFSLLKRGINLTPRRAAFCLPPFRIR